MADATLCRRINFVHFIVLVGVPIFVHESGHFLWAKLFGVRVLKFSLGFGPRIAGFSRGGTEYVIAAVPLGGYVRMLGENPHDQVAPDEESHAFHTQALWRRVVIVLAGPLMNLAFPLLLYFVVFLGTTQLSPAIVGDVFPGQPADGKFVTGDRIVAIDGEPIDTFYDLTRIVAPQAGHTLRFTVERDGERFTRADHAYLQAPGAPTRALGRRWTHAASRSISRFPSSASQTPPAPPPWPSSRHSTGSCPLPGGAPSAGWISSRCSIAIEVR